MLLRLKCNTVSCQALEAVLRHINRIVTWSKKRDKIFAGAITLRLTNRTSLSPSYNNTGSGHNCSALIDDLAANRSTKLLRMGRRREEQKTKGSHPNY